MRGSSRGRRWLVGVAVASAVAGCALPHHKSLGDASKPGASSAVAQATLASYARDRAVSDATWDVKALASLETGAVLDIDQSSLVIRRALGITARPFALDDAVTVWAPRFDSYPLWFVAVARVQKQQEQIVCVFSRKSSTDPWLLEAAPRLAGDTETPGVGRAADATVARLLPGSPQTWSDGAAVTLTSPVQQIADDYADVLTSAKSEHVDEFVTDSFITQMRQIAKEQPTQGVRFEQRWTAGDVTYVLRLADGGALMFVTLKRVDRFEVRPGQTLKFAGSEAGAYLPDPIRRKARLDYEHQVLMVVPRDGKPLVIGQYGGLVGARGR